MKRVLDCLWLSGASIILAFAITICIGIGSSYAQHNHAAGHSLYKEWSSKKQGNCCSDDDCGTLNEAEVRDTQNGKEVKIADQWCPVLSEHFIIKGKSPDWSKPHACVGKSPYHLSQPPCQRLLCFADKGGF